MLETFCEGRTLARSEVPYLGGEVDGSQFGAPPMPWDIPCEPSDHFQDQMYNIPVPHTAEVRVSEDEVPSSSTLLVSCKCLSSIILIENIKRKVLL